MRPSQLRLHTLVVSGKRPEKIYYILRVLVLGVVNHTYANWVVKVDKLDWLSEHHEIVLDVKRGILDQEF